MSQENAHENLSVFDILHHILGSRIDEWSGKKSTKWHPWTSYHITCHHMAIHTLNLIFIHHSLRISAHRTRGIVFQILVRDSTSFIKNNIKDTKTIRIVRQMLSLAAIVVILKSILKSSDLKTTPIAIATMWWRQLMNKVEYRGRLVYRQCFEWYKLDIRWLSKMLKRNSGSKIHDSNTMVVANGRLQSFGVPTATTFFGVRNWIVLCNQYSKNYRF